MKSQLLVIGLLCCTSAMLAQDYPFVVDGAVHADRSCHVRLPPAANGKPRQKKIDGLCLITKNKDVYGERSTMSNGMPRIGQTQIMEMEYSLGNPTKEPLKFILTFHLDKGFHYEPGSGPPPANIGNADVIWEKTVAPGEVLRIDLAERK